jgi:hypothetical protein
MNRLNSRKSREGRQNHDGPMLSSLGDSTVLTGARSAEAQGYYQ